MSELRLTPEQQAVVTQPADALVLVTAGAGAGKTYTLVRRLDRLMAEEELSAGEILVLTFSRAAVRELRERLARHGDGVRFLRAQTFDSWALDVLRRVDATTKWQHRSFEARIEGARQAVEDGLADDLFEDLRHVVVDEVQDLVGSRRDLVEILLERFDCGFTVVGDPAQSIYGFTVPNPRERAGETNRFFDWLRATFGEDLVELHLTDNFRAQTEEARIALEMGPLLRGIAEKGNDETPLHHGMLRDKLRDSLNLGALEAFSLEALRDYDGTTAVLCRTNGQALVVSAEMHHFGIPHRLQRSARDRVAPAWLASLFAATDGASLSRDRFYEIGLPEGENRDLVWRHLQRVGGARGGDRHLDLARLRAALAGSRLPDELTAQPPSRLVVSSFHRAKGLEFDRVVIVDPGPLVPERDEDPAEAARLLYVAMTRPRKELLWLDPVDVRHLRIDRSTGRWGRYGFQYWRRDGMELIAGDVHADQPAGTRDFTCEAGELQDYLRTKVLAGSQVLLKRLETDALETDQSPPYLIMHDRRPVGTASEGFKADLYRHLKTSKSFVPRNWPRSIDEVFVDGLETVAGSESAGIRAGLGPHGVWLVPRLVGLGRFTWDKKEDAGDEAQ
ncbi:hypothetical protein FHU36_001758 [Nonomuraea muscovyensis]|uniref:DNA 3'-5' helicase n=1 Tax=Nonomuraea muscovyensis TaxID=1124761 RepID=A0A7X0BYI1_9ACTN|nr:ATP-dependent helicase [Nonomuraea muscovyensis]MBB6345249.1 hypothetical protein [Nonomuraea muscovyensis]